MWKSAAIPAQEPERLQELFRYGILDTPPEPAFDRLTKLAAEFFSTEIAYIAFIDEARHWCKSANLAEVATVVPREQTLCSHVVANRHSLVIGDLQSDQRLHGHPFVSKLPYAFYAGSPLVSPSGQVLGTFCVLDRQSRSDGAFSVTALEDFAAICVDELELRRRNAELARLATTDALTGLENRRGFDVTLDRELRRCRRTGSKLCLLMIDVDRFKTYNDALGHQAGDEALKQVAAVLQASVSRAYDLPARYGGEEFALVLPETDAKGARAIAEQILARLKALAIPHPGNDPGYLTVSIGCSYARKSDMTASLVQRADRALYAAKRMGGSRVCAELSEAARERCVG